MFFRLFLVLIRLESCFGDMLWFCSRWIIIVGLMFFEWLGMIRLLVGVMFIVVLIEWLWLMVYIEVLMFRW